MAQTKSKPSSLNKKKANKSLRWMITMKLEKCIDWTDDVEIAIRNRIRHYILEKFNDKWGYVMQIEFDIKNDMYKLKAYIETKKPQDFETIRNIFTMGKYNYIPHVEKVTKFNRLSCIKHCSKIENRVGNAWSSKLKVQDHPPDPLEGKELRPFQQQIMDILKTDPDDRVIHWYWDYGNTGKSAFIKHMIIKYGKKNVFPIGGQKGIIQKYMLHKLNNSENFRYLFFDLSRSDEKHFPYDVMEKLKDGIVHTGSYGGYRTFLIPTPHIIIFAHFPPNRYSISTDRWHIVEVGDNGEIVDEELPEKNVNNVQESPEESSEELDS